MPAVIKNLAEGTLPSTTGSLYTVPASTSAVVLTINLVNSDSVTRTCNLYYLKSGSSQRLLTPENLSMDAGYQAPFKVKVTMAAGDSIRGDASAAAVVEYVVSGVEIATTAPAPPTDDLPTLQKVTVVVPQASVATLFSVPYVLVSGTPSSIVIPEYAHVSKPAGSGWTTTGSGKLRIGWGATTAISFEHYDQATTTAFFGASADTWISFTNGTFIGVLGTYYSIFGESIVLRLPAADISGGTGDLTVTLWYRVWSNVL